jgi:hypothetical protein
MLLGLLGCVSHSSLHSRKINSFSVYTLMLYGSFLPPSVKAGTTTFRFVRYFSSSLYGCRAPDVRRSVISSTGPASLVTSFGSISIDGPIATESSRWVAGVGVDEEEGSAADTDADAVWAVFSIDKGSLLGCEDTAAFEVHDDSCSGFVFSLAVFAAAADSDMVEDGKTERKEEEIGDVVGIET